MHNAVLRTVTGCAQDTNIQYRHEDTLILPMPEHLQLHTSKYKRKHNIHHTAYASIQHTSRLKPTIFNNGRYTTNIPTYPSQSLQAKYNKHAAYAYIYILDILAQEAKTKYSAHFHHTLAALKGYFHASLIALLPKSEPINHPFSNHTYTKSTPNHTHHPL